MGKSGIPSTLLPQWFCEKKRCKGIKIYRKIQAVKITLIQRKNNPYLNNVVILNGVRVIYSYFMTTCCLSSVAAVHLLKVQGCCRMSSVTSFCILE